MSIEMTDEKFRTLCDLTVKLTDYRLLYCNNLCIENFAPKLFHKLLCACNDEFASEMTPQSIINTALEKLDPEAAEKFFAQNSETVK